MIPAVLRRFPVRRVILAAILGGLTTLAVSWSLAAWSPISRGRPTISRDGDHIQLWLLRLDAPGASRTFWFEKGRVYGRTSRGGPAGASSAAVSCWSFATSQRQHPRGELREFPMPPELQELYSAEAPLAWGAALDRRGWPFPAFESVVVAPMDADSPAMFTSRTGLVLTPDPTVGNRENLAEVRVLPIRPIPLGLLANTALAAAAWYVLLLVPGAVLAGVRRPRGLCPSCGYDLRADLAGGCPECGWNRPDPASARAG